MLAGRAVMVGRGGGERRGILAVLDGSCPPGVEDEAGEAWRSLNGAPWSSMPLEEPVRCIGGMVKTQPACFEW